jgi:long-chain acyl-CoA synthetase
MPETVLDLFRQRVELHPHRAAYRTLRGAGAERDEVLTWNGWWHAAEAFAAVLVSAGCLPGDRVAILAGNRLLWPIADLGILLAGCVAVGIYPTSAAGQVRQILADSGAVAVLVDTAEQMEKVGSVRGELHALRIVIAEAAHGSCEVEGWTDCLLRGSDLIRRGGTVHLEDRRGLIAPEADALLVYTSGSTGEPRGARLSHRCVLASAESIRDTLELTEADSSLSFLPFCHSAERIFGLYTRILCGMEALLVEDHRLVWQAAATYGPTVFGGLPRHYEKVYEAFRSSESALPPAERELLRRVIAWGRKRSILQREGAALSAAEESEWRSQGEPFFRRARDFFGGRIRLATSGGASLPLEVAEYLAALDLPVLGAYGLTEHLCVAFNRRRSPRFDTAGPPMPGTRIRIAADGEIEVRRSALTFSGYHGRVDETRETFTPDGQWLLTGDFGRVEADGSLRVTGRKKELIALSTGKKVAPLPIEAMLVTNPCIGQAVVIGEGRKYLSALLVLRRPIVEEWARERGLALAFDDLLRHPDLLEHVQVAVDAVNARLSSPERIRRFHLLARELSLEHDELTPTLKVRRAVVAARYQEELAALYPIATP